MDALMVIAEMGSGGAETVVADLAGHLASTGEGVCVASNGGWRADALGAAGIRTIEIPLREPGPRTLLRSGWALGRELRRNPVDVVHTHNVRASAAAYLATRFVRRRPPIVTTVHGLASEDYPTAARLLERTADLVVAVSEDVADRLRASGLPGARLRVVENAVTVGVLPARTDARADLDLDLPDDAEVVLCLARLIPPKRQDLLIQAWRLLEGRPRLLMAGDGPARDELEAQVRETGLSDRITFLGDRRDVPRLLAASDLLVLPSDREGLPMTVLEAMSAGVPVVASSVGGLAALDPAAIELVAAGSAAALSEGVTRVLSDAARRQGMIAAAHGLIGSRFSAPVMRERYEKAYSGLRDTARQ